MPRYVVKPMVPERLLERSFEELFHTGGGVSKRAMPWGAYVLSSVRYAAARFPFLSWRWPDGPA